MIEGSPADLVVTGCTALRTTIVDGRILMRNRELLTIDVPAVLNELGERMPALLDRSHGKQIQDYTTQAGARR